MDANVVGVETEVRCSWEGTAAF